MKCLQIRVFGKVQGVWFRASTQRKAEELGLKGFVKNEKGGSVYIEVFGKKEILTTFLDWCDKGPELARVDAVECNEIEKKDFLDFRVVR